MAYHAFSVGDRRMYDLFCIEFFMAGGAIRAFLGKNRPSPEEKAEGGKQ
jgi:hypothetical protein